MKTYCLLVLAIALDAIQGDIFLHNPRGSNDRNCPDSNSENRQNGNRLFDSQNNAKGGYACPRAYPFACYKKPEGTERDACNALNTGLTDAEAKAQALPDGTVAHPEAVNTPKMFYYSGSEIPIEWTNQHGGGSNQNVYSDIILQVSCEETEVGLENGAFSFTDDCGTPGLLCQPRDGTPIHNQDQENHATIDDNVDDQDNYRKGRHESYQYYQRCKNLERNKGLWIADRNINGNDARFSRQNDNGARRGLECPEESEHYPWWQPSMWIDIAVITNNLEKCQAKVKESQNVFEKSYCSCTSNQCKGNGNLPIDERTCKEKDGEWKAFPSFKTLFATDDIAEPVCVQGAFSRDNHLGNVGVDGQPFTYKWSVPSFLEGKKNCVLRARYNISTADYDDLTNTGDSLLNAKDSPIQDRNNNPEKVYRQLTNLCGDGSPEQCKLAVAINSNQFGRTFQDRSYTFEVKPRPSDIKCDNIYNLNVRGKRGNIVQNYPAVEYDFVPNTLEATEADCVHVQWTGSDYNPARNANDGEGGPPHPRDTEQGKTDRSNMVQAAAVNANHPISDMNEFSMFETNRETYQRLAFLDQNILDSGACKDYTTLFAENGNNRNNAERDYRNCMKLSGQSTPYFNGGLLKPAYGTHSYMSTRNNNFSNRSQKATMVIAGAPISGAGIAGITIGSLAVLGFIGFAAVTMRKGQNSKKNTLTPTGGALISKTKPGSHSVETAAHDHKASEPGELSFKKGEKITVLQMDESGWWEGKLSNGTVGVFPSNFLVGVNPTSSV